MPESFQDLMDTLPQVGRLESIWLRPGRREPPAEVEAVAVELQSGLVGDRYRGRSTRSRRQVTLIQAEHLPVIAALSGHDAVSPGALRRNLVVSGLPLVALKGRAFAIGDDVILEYTVPCDPCRRMEEVLGPGGFNAMRGMGGVCTRVLRAGEIRVGDAVRALSSDEADAARQG